MSWAGSCLALAGLGCLVRLAGQDGVGGLGWAGRWAGLAWCLRCSELGKLGKLAGQLAGWLAGWHFGWLPGWPAFFRHVTVFFLLEIHTKA